MIIEVVLYNVFSGPRLCISLSLLFHFYLENALAQDFYEAIDQAGMLQFLKDFLNSDSADVRAKACSAIGNMCRHSCYFYNSLVRYMSSYSISFSL